MVFKGLWFQQHVGLTRLRLVGVWSWMVSLANTARLAVGHNFAYAKGESAE